MITLLIYLFIFLIIINDVYIYQLIDFILFKIKLRVINKKNKNW